MLKSLKKKPKTVKTPVNMKIDPAVKKKLEVLAKKYARGNLTLWLCYAGMNYKPSKKDLT